MTLIRSSKSGKYSAVIQTNHGKRAISTGTADRKEALQIAKEAKVDELERSNKIARLTGTAVAQIVAGKKVTIADASKEWITWLENYGQSMRSVDNVAILFGAWVRGAKLADKLPSEITERMVDAWVNAHDKVGAGSRRMRLSVVRSFFKFCCAKAYALGNPSQLVRVKMSQLTHAQKEPKVVQAFTGEELDKLTAAATGFWRAAIIIGRHTGLRLGDICQLERDCLEVPGKITIWTDKRDRRVSLPVEGELKVTLNSLMRTHPRFLFPTQQEIIMNSKHRAMLSVQFSRLCKKTSIEGKSYHSVRHYFVSEMTRRGIPIEHIAQSVGHRSVTTTRGYISE